MMAVCQVKNKLHSSPCGFMSGKSVISEGDEVIVYVKFGVAHAITVSRGQTLQMQFGALRHDFLIGKEFGSRISATKGYIYVLKPTAELWTQTLEHRTQILYTPDISIVCLTLELKPGSVVLEAGTGSAALSHALARAIFPSGHLYSFDVDENRISAARTELASHGFAEVLTLELRDVCAGGFGKEDEIDAVFLDLPRPWEVVPSAKNALRNSGGRFCAFSPCIEQAQRTCQALRSNGFIFLETVECVPRQLKVTEPKMRILVPKGETDPRPQDTVFGKELEPKSKRAREDSSNGIFQVFQSVVSFPFQQPTHTGFLTSASSPPVV